jgi:hypothetical protein
MDFRYLEVNSYSIGDGRFLIGDGRFMVIKVSE